MTTGTVVITGANKGIGYAVARRLGGRGWTVYVGSRDAGRGRTAATTLRTEGIDARNLTIDVTDDASIADAVAVCGEQSPVVDVLINNAGIADSNPLPSATGRDELRSVFEVNVFGVVAVTNAFLPLLSRSARPRIVNVSSEVGSVTSVIGSPGSLIHEGLRALPYAMSKAAMNMLTGQYAKELAPMGAKVNAAIPGPAATDLNRFGTARTADAAATVVEHLATLPDDGPTGRFWGQLIQDPEGQYRDGAW